MFGHPRGICRLSLFEITRAKYIIIYFHENFRCILSYYESENFSDSSLHHIFESENCRFPFLYEKLSLSWAVKCD